MTDLLIRAEHVRKKFCRSLRKSLLYGVQDIAADLFGGGPRNAELRSGEFYAVDDISFNLHRGECLGIIGRNGAGKTTLLKMLNGLIKPDQGEIRVRGRLGALIALGAGFSPLLSGRENIFINAAILGMSKGDVVANLERIIDFAEIREFIDAPVQSYSSGMVVRLGFAIAVHCKPDSLLLDEVLAVGDTAFQAKCFNTLSDFRRKGIGFILVSHNFSIVDCFCDRVLYLKRGRRIFDGDTQIGIAQFNRDMLAEESAGSEKVASGEVCGNGKVVLRRVAFKDDHGRYVSELRTGDPVILELEYQCQSEEAVSGFVDIHIKDQAGVFYHDPHAAELDEIRGRGLLRIRFDSVPANNQRLYFSIALAGRQDWELFDWKCDVPLTVYGEPTSQGRVHLRCQSRVCPVQDAAIAV